MKAAIALFLLALLLLASAPHAYKLTDSRDELLSYYYANIDGRIPKSARMLLGDERINVYTGGRAMGIETVRGQLYSFEMEPLSSPTITVTVSDTAADAISKRKMGILQAMDSGGVRIEAKNFLSALKVEAMKRIYAVSGADNYFSGRRASASAATYNSIYAQRARIVNSLFSG